VATEVVQALRQARKDRAGDDPSSNLSPPTFVMNVG